MYIHLDTTEPAVRETIRQLLAHHSEHYVAVDSAESATVDHPAVDSADSLVLLHLTGSSQSGGELRKRLEACENTSRKVLVVSDSEDEQFAAQCIRMGARGYLRTADISSELLPALEQVTNNQIFLCGAVSDALAFRFIEKGGGS